MAITAEYMNMRKQFGVTIGSFQALRHRAADMKMQLELARSMSYYASLKLNAAAPERRAAMARAKYQLGNSMRFVGQQSVQLHGGIGVTDEYAASHYFKRLTVIEMSFGDTMFHLGEVSARMQDTAEGFGQPIRQIFDPLFLMKRELPSPFDEHPLYRVTVQDHFWRWLYLPIVDLANQLARLFGLMQQGRISVYLLYSFLTLVATLVVVMR